MSEALTITISAKDAASGIVGRLRQGIGQSMARLKTTIAAPFTAAKKVASAALSSIKAGAVATAAAIGTAFAAVKFVEIGANLALTEKSFMSLTGTSQQSAQAIAKSLQEASGGGLTLTKTMQRANKLLNQGLDLSSIEKIFDVSNKAAGAFGGSVEAAIQAVGTAIATGRVQSLQSLGLIRNGIKDVTEAYDSMHGEGAFAKLSNQQQKAVQFNAVMGELQGGLQRLGLTGQETALRLDAFTTPLKDALAHIARGVSESQAFASVLQWVEAAGKRLTAWAENFDLDYVIASFKHVISSIGAVAKAFFTMPGFAFTAMKHVGMIIVNHMKWALKSWWELIKGAASIIWEPIKFGAKAAWVGIVRGARDAASGVWRAWLGISFGIKKLFARATDWIAKPFGKALVAVGQMLDKLQESFPDMARIPGLENLGEKIVAIGSNMQRSQKSALQEVQKEADVAYKKVAEFDERTMKLWKEGTEGTKKAWGEMWDNIFEKGVNTSENLKKSFKEMTDSQKKELAELLAMLTGVMPDKPVKAPKASTGGGTPAATGGGGGGGGGTGGGGEGQAPPAAKKAYGWLERAGKGLSSAADRLGGAGGGGGGLGAMGGGSARQQKWETMVQKELKAMAKGVAGGMGRERQAARAEARRRVGAERKRRQEGAFKEKEGKLAEAVQSGLISEEEADAAREKTGEKTFGKKGWKKRKESQSKESQREKLAEEFDMKDWKKGKGKGKGKGKDAGKDKGGGDGDVPEGGGETAQAVDQLQAALMGKLNEMIANDQNAAQKIQTLQAVVNSLAAQV